VFYIPESRSVTQNDTVSLIWSFPLSLRLHSPLTVIGYVDDSLLLLEDLELGLLSLNSKNVSICITKAGKNRRKSRESSSITAAKLTLIPHIFGKLRFIPMVK
jgi:hypothetical protein